MNRKLFSTLLLGLLLTTSTTCGAADTLSINRGWFFKLGESGNSSITADKAKADGWREINVPHDFQIEQPWVAPDASEKADNSDAGANIKSRLSARGFKEMGGGWYVKAINIPSDRKGKKAYLDFQGIMYYADVYFNGKRVGGTNYGYVGFDIDITDKIRFGEENTIAVYANTATPKNSRWYTGGGLFRDVNLIFKNPTLYFERHPLRITTEENKKVNIGVEFFNGTKEKEVSIQVTIKDPKGNVVSNDTHSLKLNRNTRHQELPLPTTEIANPQLWDCDTPNLYQVTLSLLNPDGSVADATTSTFGIRTIEFGPDFGMKLNGKKVLLKGYANHHTLGALGAAAYPAAIEKRIKLIKEYGMNHIRTSHNPYSEEFLNICDRYGILVVDELYDKWNAQYVGGGRSDWSQNWQSDVTEWVKRDRNHPCVVMWSLGNELQSYNDQPFNDWGVTCYKLQNTLLKRYDNTRKTTVAMHPRYRNWETDSLPCDLAINTEIQSYNYRYMYFPGDSKRFPWMTFYQSEASAANMGENYFAMNLDKVIGLAYWGAIDYLGESQGWPTKGWRQGVFDISLEPKPKAFYLRSFFKEEEPVVHIAVVDKKSKDVMWNGIQTGNDGMSDHWNRQAGSKINLITYTNADEVELFVNGKSQGVKQNDRSSAKMRNQIHWDNVEYKEGNCLAVARNNGKEVARHKIETTGKAVALKIETDNDNWKADGIDLQHVRVIAVDSKGRRVQTAVADVKFSVSGDATLAAVSSGNMDSDELNVTDHRSLYRGSCLAILRAGTNPSTVTITATADGLKAAKLSFPCGQAAKGKKK